MQYEPIDYALLRTAIEKLYQGFELPVLPASFTLDQEDMQAAMQATALRMQDNYPYFHPFYLGQMLKPPHPIALHAYTLAMTINPNNHALDGGKASSAMEKEIITQFLDCFDLAGGMGHLTSSGTLANLEALWVAGQLHPDKLVLASEQAHYTHARICGVLGIKYASVPANKMGKIDVVALRRQLDQGNVGTLVLTLGTTGLGALDELASIAELKEKYGIRIHIDAAYGGFFHLLDHAAAFQQLAYADSFVIDPHKHGMQPYGCGCVLFRDPEVGQLYKHDSPYTYFSSAALHLGEISLECSRAGASAVALWASLQYLGLGKRDRLAQSLEYNLKAADWFAAKIKAHPDVHLVVEPELDIVVFYFKAKTAQGSSEKALAFYDALEAQQLYIALLELEAQAWNFNAIDVEEDARIKCLRICLMKPEHYTYREMIWERMEKVLGLC